MASAATTRVCKRHKSRRNTTSIGSIRNPATSKLSSTISWSRTASRFSPDEKKLYIIDTGLTDGPDNPAHIRVFDVDIDSGKVSNGKVFADNFRPGFTDGMRC